LQNRCAVNQRLLNSGCGERSARSTVGVKFRRQHVIGKFIVDFIAPTATLVIEVDGAIHQYSYEESSEKQSGRLLQAAVQLIVTDLRTVNTTLKQMPSCCAAGG